MKLAYKEEYRLTRLMYGVCIYLQHAHDVVTTPLVQGLGLIFISVRLRE